MPDLLWLNFFEPLFPTPFSFFSPFSQFFLNAPVIFTVLKAVTIYSGKIRVEKSQSLMQIWLRRVYETQNRKPSNKQKTSQQSYKTQIKILPFSGLAQALFTQTWFHLLLHVCRQTLYTTYAEFVKDKALQTKPLHTVNSWYIRITDLLFLP